MNSKTDIDLVLIHPGHRTRIYQSLGNEITAIETPIWAGLVANFVRHKGFSVAIIDGEAENLSPEQVVQRVVDMKPLLAAVVVYGHQPSASSQNMTVAGEMCTTLKELNPNLNILMFGGHVAALPERTMQEEDIDFAACGEGPYTVVDLLSALKSSQPNFSKVRGLCYRENEVLRFNPAPPLVNDLNHEMPGIAWDLLPMDGYRDYNWHCFGNLKRKPYAAIYSTLGCPYHCTFCCIQSPFKEGEKASGLKANVNSYRFWNPEFVIQEIDKLVNEYGISNLRFSDEMFVLNMRHVYGICDLIMQRGYKLNIYAYARIDTVKDDRTIDKLKAAGFNWLCFGIESASEHVRDDVEKNFSQEEIYDVVKRVRTAGINVMANYIFGLPEDDMKSMQTTLDQAIDLNCEFANFYCAMAYPGSQLYQIALNEKWQLPKEWTGYSQHSIDSLPLPTKYLSSAEVIRFRDNAWQKYFTSPKYLNMIEKKFGTETVKDIRHMTSYKLERQHA